MAYNEVNKQSVYLCTGQPLPEDITQIVEWMLSDDFITAYQSENSFVHFTIYVNIEITHLKVSQGLALQDILTEVHSYVHRGRVIANMYYFHSTTSGISFSS